MKATKERTETLDAGMHSRTKEIGSLTLYPFTLAAGQILEEQGNRYAEAKEFEPKMQEVNELMFVMTHDIDDLLALTDSGDWRKAVLRFASGLDSEQIAAIEQHCADEMDKVQASEVTPREDNQPGKRRPIKTGG